MAHLQTQQDGKRNQSMKMPLHSLLGSKARRRCHLYFCSHEQSRLHLFVDGNVQISWWMACSKFLLLTMARTFWLLFTDQYGVVTSILLSHTSILLEFVSGVPGNSACLFSLFRVAFVPSKKESSSIGITISSKVPSNTSRRNLGRPGTATNGAETAKLETGLKVLTTLTVVLVTVCCSCSSPYILLMRALLSSMNLSIDFVGYDVPADGQNNWLSRFTQGRPLMISPPPLFTSIPRMQGKLTIKEISFDAPYMVKICRYL